MMKVQVLLAVLALTQCTAGQSHPSPAPSVPHMDPGSPGTNAAYTGVARTDTFHNSGSSSYSNSGSSSYSSYSYNSNSNCPQQTDFSADLQLSNDPTGYPTDAINTELTARQDLLNCLAREVVLPTAPQVPTDPVIAQAQDTCPSIKPELWSFVRYTGKCWIIRNVQEVLNFTICGFTHCQSCNDFFSASSGTSKKCVREFQYFSVWAFCEGLPAQNQISRERIILPVSCSCKTIHCYANDWWWRR